MLRAAMQNENLVAWRDEVVLITVPDLICILHDATGEPIGTGVPRYGLRVCMLGFAADPRLTTPAALAVVGPRAFGYNLAYRPLVQCPAPPRCIGLNHLHLGAHRFGRWRLRCVTPYR